MNIQDKLLQILAKIDRNNMNKKESSQLLISLFQNSHDKNIQYECLRQLKRYIDVSNENFNFLENLLISDEDPYINTIAAELLIDNFPEKSTNSFKWIIHNNDSPILLNKVFTLISHSEHKKIKELRPIINEWYVGFGQKLKLHPDEVQFILDIETLFALKLDNSKRLTIEIIKFYHVLSELANHHPWFLIKEGHIRQLKFNFYKWKFLREYRGKAGSLKYYYDLNLLLSLLIQMRGNNRYAIQIPPSISHLTYLEKLDISENNLSHLPSTMKYLHSLTHLDLSHNNFNTIPSVLFSLKNVKDIDLRYNKIKSIPPSIKKIDTLEKINLKGNKIRSIPDSTKEIVIIDS